MSNQNHFSSMSAPCIIDNGLIVNQEDLYRLLNDLGHVRYYHYLDGECSGQGEGYIVEVFHDNYQATLIANQTIYINLASFDYLQLETNQQQTHFNLIQEERTLSLVPVSSPLQDYQANQTLDPLTLEAILTDVLSAHSERQSNQEDDQDFV